MNAVRELTEDDMDILYHHDFPSGRPLNFHSPAVSGGFSLVAGLSNLLGKVNVCERTPDWVRQDCETACRELIEAAMLLPYASRIPINHTGGSHFGVSIERTFIRVNAKEGPGRIVLLLGKQKAWIISAWNGKTGEAQKLPVLGRSITIPIKCDKEKAKRKREEAQRQALEELNRMQERERVGTLRHLRDALIAIVVIGLMMWFGGYGK